MSARWLIVTPEGERAWPVTFTSRRAAEHAAQALSSERDATLFVTNGRTSTEISPKEVKS